MTLSILPWLVPPLTASVLLLYLRDGLVDVVATALGQSRFYVILGVAILTMLTPLLSLIQKWTLRDPMLKIIVLTTPLFVAGWSTVPYLFPSISKCTYKSITLSSGQSSSLCYSTASQKCSLLLALFAVYFASTAISFPLSFHMPAAAKSRGQFIVVLVFVAGAGAAAAVADLALLIFTVTLSDMHLRLWVRVLVFGVGMTIVKMANLRLVVVLVSKLTSLLDPKGTARDSNPLLPKQALVFFLVSTILVMTVSQIYAIFRSADNYRDFLLTYLPHALLVKVAWITRHPTVRASTLEHRIVVRATVDGGNAARRAGARVKRGAELVARLLLLGYKSRTKAGGLFGSLSSRVEPLVRAKEDEEAARTEEKDTPHIEDEAGAKALDEALTRQGGSSPPVVVAAAAAALPLPLIDNEALSLLSLTCVVAAAPPASEQPSTALPTVLVAAAPAPPLESAAGSSSSSSSSSDSGARRGSVRRLSVQLAAGAFAAVSVSVPGAAGARRLSVQLAAGALEAVAKGGEAASGARRLSVQLAADALEAVVANHGGTKVSDGVGVVATSISSDALRSSFVEAADAAEGISWLAVEVLAREMGEVYSLEVSTFLTFPWVAAFVMHPKQFGDVGAGVDIVHWLVCTLLIAFPIDQILAVLGFLTLEGAGVQLDSNFGLAGKNIYNAYGFFRANTSADVIKFGLVHAAGMLCVIVCIAGGDA